MQDEHFMRQWSAGHARFSADVDKARVEAGRALRQTMHRLGTESRLARKARLNGLAILAGILGGAGIAIVLPVLVALACPETGHTTGDACVAAALA